MAGSKSRFPDNVVLEEDPFIDNFPMCVRISGPGLYEPEKEQKNEVGSKQRNFDTVEASENDRGSQHREKAESLDQAERLRQGERNMSNAANYEYGADDYSDMLEHLARFVEIAQDYGIEIRRATDDDDNSGYVPLTRDYIENDGVPRLTVIKCPEDDFWDKAFSSKSVAVE